MTHAAAAPAAAGGARAARRARPGLIVTGASGFVGRHLLEALKDDYTIYGIARRSQSRSGAPVHPNIVWYQVDISERGPLEHVFEDIRARGGASIALHLAAYYDFTGEEHPEYERTNVRGTRHVFDACRDIGVRHVVFSSSVAACRFPRVRHLVSEVSPPAADHPYGRTKRAGEEMLSEYAEDMHGVVARFAALFSDWCEYPPLFVFINTWLSSAWNARILGGHGDSAVPYLHVHELGSFFRHLLDRIDRLPQDQVLLASPDGAVSHRELFEGVTFDYYGQRVPPVHVPRTLCGPGIRLMDLVGRLLGTRPFERPWMVPYIDQQLSVDARETRRLLEWRPRPRLEILRRLPFLIENYKTDPLEWHRRNRAAMKEVPVRANLRVHQLLEKHAESISEEFTRRLAGPEAAGRFPNYQRLARDEHEWNHRLVLDMLNNAVRNRDRVLFADYCRALGERRFQQGFRCEEVCAALDLLNDLCVDVLTHDAMAEGLSDYVHEHVTMTLRLGMDEIEGAFEDLAEERERRVRREAEARDAADGG